jgi:hypothetical protein
MPNNDEKDSYRMNYDILPSPTSRDQAFIFDDSPGSRMKVR